VTAAPKDDEFATFLASQPAAVPAPWPWELILAAAETAMIFAPMRSSSLRGFAWLGPALSVVDALRGVRESLERRRARELGLQRVGDLPRALQRLPHVPLPLSTLSERARAPVLLPPLHPIVTGASLLLATARTALAPSPNPHQRRW